MHQELIINILGPNSLSALNNLTLSISENNCNILDSRHAQYGTDFSLTMIVNGTGADITALEMALSQLCVSHDLLCLMKRTTGHQKQNIGQYIKLAFSGNDATGVMQQITHTVSEFGLSVHALRQTTRALGTDVELSCKMILSAPKDMELDTFDSKIKALLHGLGLHGKISHKPLKENDEYIESW